MKMIMNKTFDEERALYGSKDIEVSDCRFDGPADGESALKECSNVKVSHCLFNLRYPFWHDKELSITDCEMTELCRAPIWYSDHIEICNTKMHGIKALRECNDIEIKDCNIISPEFGWSAKNIAMKNSIVSSEYCLMRAENIHFTEVSFNGKYSFQYIKDAVFEHCHFDTKDAFWHAENVLVKDSTVKGEYLAWYSNGLTLENCTIIGTQPLCYCKNLKLINCEMIDADLCFEKSAVEATITSPVLSIKNPLSGIISLPSIGEIIRDDKQSKGEIRLQTGANAIVAP